MHLLLLALPARAATLEVCATCAYTSVDDALAAAEADDEIAIDAGFWTVGPTLDLPVTLSGAGEGATVLVPADGAAAVLRVEGAAVALTDLTIDGQELVRGVTVASGSLDLQRVTVTRGASSSGAGVYVGSGGALSAAACSFTANVASGGSGGHLAMQSATLVVEGCAFTGGQAASGGGVWASDSSLSITGAVFQDNLAQPASGSGYGGALRLGGGALDLRDSSFSANEVQGSGAGGSLALSDGTATLSGVTIASSAAPNGGGVYLDEVDAVLVDVELLDNTATDPTTNRGGGLAAFGGTVQVVDSTLSGNRVDGGASFAAGGGLYANTAAVELLGVRLLDNTVEGDDAVYGGGLYVNDADLLASELWVEGNRTEGSTSGVLGGGVFVRGAVSRADLAACSFSGNEAGYAGGALFTTDGSAGGLEALTLTDCAFEDNLAAVGGALALYGEGTVDIAASRFTGNLGQDVGGAVFWRPGEALARTGALTMTDTTLRDNESLGGGGALAAYYGASLELLHVELVGNTAEDGGGLYASDLGRVEVAHAWLCGNAATADDGGGASLTGTAADGEDEWAYTVVVDNSAADNGGGVQYYEWLGALRVVNNSFVGNTTTDNGGGLYAYGADEVELVNNLWAHTGSGGGVYLGEVVEAEAIRYNAWYDNAAAHLAGATTTWGTGNLVDEDPGLYAYTPGGACDSQILTHDPAGPLADAGDPSILDGDGSRSDIGAYGGPETDPAELEDGDGDGWPGAVDCDDARPSVHPGAEEVPYDGLDNDCEGGDLCDVDGDGYEAEACGGADCGDEDAGVHPGAEDAPGDGVDADCDGADGDGGDGGAGDGGSSDGGAADGGAGDGGAGDGGAADGGAADGGSSDGGAADGGSSDGGAVDGGAADKGDGCGCASGRGGGGLLLPGLLTVLLLRRRR